jgi:hypothetical protein
VLIATTAMLGAATGVLALVVRWRRDAPVTVAITPGAATLRVPFR